MDIEIGVQNIVYAAITALVLTWIVEFFLRSFSVMFGRTTIFEYKHGDFERVVFKCYNLFPKDTVIFRDKIYCRGTVIRIITLEQKMLEGSLIGQNYDNMVCLLTKRYIIAHDLANIKEIIVID